MSVQTSFFDSERSSFEEAVAQVILNLCTYAQGRAHWAFAWSGGKDSTTNVTLVPWLVEAAKAVQSGRPLEGKLAGARPWAHLLAQMPIPESLTAFVADTRLDPPPIMSSARILASQLKECGIETHFVTAPLDERWLVYVLGRGVPPPHSTFWWCTEKVKGNPVEARLSELQQTLYPEVRAVPALSFCANCGSGVNRSLKRCPACRSHQIADVAQTSQWLDHYANERHTRPWGCCDCGARYPRGAAPCIRCRSLRVVHIGVVEATFEVPWDSEVPFLPESWSELYPDPPTTLGRPQILMLTGVRRGESTTRDARISLACSRDDAECGQGYYQFMEGSTAAVLAPIDHLRLCQVIDWLWLLAPQEAYGGWATELVVETYGGGKNAEEQALRFGCMGCTMVSRDHGLERLVQSEDWKHLAPYLQLRSLFAEMRGEEGKKHRLRKPPGERTRSGQLVSMQNRIGPLTLEARAYFLARILDLQEQVNQEARRRGRPEASILNTEEIERIETLISNQTWPRGWSGNEPRADAFYAEADGLFAPSNGSAPTS